MTPRLLTTTEVAAQLGVSDETVRRYIINGELAATNIGIGRARLRVTETALAAFVTSRGMGVR